MRSVENKKKELTGRHVLIMLLSFFGIMLVVNGYFLYAAIDSFRGEDVKGSYRQGLEYNKTIDARIVQDLLGWTVRSNYIAQVDGKTRVIVKLTDAKNRPLENLSVSGKLRHPTDLAKDRVVEFAPVGSGRYVAQTPAVEGKYTLIAVAQREDEIFRFKSDIFLK